MRSRQVHRSAVPAAMLALLLAPDAARAQQFWSEVPIPPLREIAVPQPEIYTLRNGLRVFLLEDRTLPKVEATLLLRTGAIWEPADKTGLASIAGQVMRTGGTASRSGDQINELLENEGATVETAIGRDSASASMFVLSEDLKLGLEILADIVQNPAFPEDKLELAKLQERAAIARRNDQIDQITLRQFRKALYGDASPYARHTEYATLEAISRQDLLTFHQQYFWPGNAMLGLVGDFDSKAAKSLIEQSFGAWKGKGKRPEMPPTGQTRQQAVFIVDKADVAQTQFRMGHVGGRRDAPDYFAMEVFTEIFGGGTFSSRLVKEVRTRLGLAYSVGGYWLAEYERDGAFLIGGGTKNESTAQAMRAAMDVLRHSLESAPTDEELSLAKDAILNSFVFRFDTRTKIVRQLMEYAYHGYPMDFLQRYKTGIEAVGARDVLAAARRNIKPERLVFLAAGKASEFRESLQALGLGQLETMDISIPPPAGQALPAADEASLERGAELWEAVRAAYGGEALAKVQAVRYRGSIQIQTPMGAMSGRLIQVFQGPDKLHAAVELPMGQLQQGYDGSSAWMKGPMGQQELTGSEADEVRQDLFLEPLNLLRAEGLNVQYLQEEPGEAPGHLLRVAEPGEAGRSVVVKVAADGGRILEMRYQSNGPEGPGEAVAAFSDFRPVQGVLFAFREEVQQAGRPVSSTEYESIELNPQVDEALFSMQR
jgi:zinc protease